MSSLWIHECLSLTFAPLEDERERERVKVALTQFNELTNGWTDVQGLKATVQANTE